MDEGYAGMPAPIFCGSVVDVAFLPFFADTSSTVSFVQAIAAYCSTKGV